MRRLSYLAVFVAVWLAGCDMLGIESAEAIAGRREAEGKAVGGACRQAGRALENCFAANRKSDKAAIYAGWREMNDYMRENNIATAPPPEATAERAAPARGAAEPVARKAAPEPPRGLGKPAS